MFPKHAAEPRTLGGRAARPPPRPTTSAPASIHSGAASSSRCRSSASRRGPGRRQNLPRRRLRPGAASAPQRRTDSALPWPGAGSTPRCCTDPASPRPVPKSALAPPPPPPRVAPRATRAHVALDTCQFLWKFVTDWFVTEVLTTGPWHPPFFSTLPFFRRTTTVICHLSSELSQILIKVKVLLQKFSYKLGGKCSFVTKFKSFIIKFLGDNKGILFLLV